MKVLRKPDLKNPASKAAPIVQPYRALSLVRRVKGCHGRCKKSPRLVLPLFKIKRFELRSASVLHVVWISFPVILDGDDQITLSLTGA